MSRLLPSFPRPVLRPCARHRRVAPAVRLALVAAFLFALVAMAVNTLQPLAEAEARWLRSLHAQRSDTLTGWMRGVAQVHDPVVAVLLSVFVTALIFQRRWRPLTLLLAITLGGGCLNNLAKAWFQRERPGVEALVPVHGFGFPSGHAVAATLLAAWMLHRLHRPGVPFPWRLAGTLAAVAMVGLVGFSRIYLGAHFPSDVMAALLAGTAWAGGCIALFAALETPGTSHPVPHPPAQAQTRNMP